MLGLWKAPGVRVECNSHGVNKDEFNQFDVEKILDFHIESAPANATVFSQHTCQYPEHSAGGCLKECKESAEEDILDFM